MDDLVFEWDEKKNKANVEKHGVDFLDAATIFENEIVLAVDDRKNYGEKRYVAYGKSVIGVLRVVFTKRGANGVRIISAWRASSNDKEKYNRTIQSERN